MKSRLDPHLEAAAVAEMTAHLKAGNIDALVEITSTLQAATGNEKLVGLMINLIFDLLPVRARKRIMASKAPSNVIRLRDYDPQ